ncbi:hypothetical protein ACFLT9_00885 [Acidobacteriota bacterium]
MLPISILAFTAALGLAILTFYQLIKESSRWRSEFYSAFIRNIFFFDLLICFGVFFNQSNTLIYKNLDSKSFFIYQFSLILVMAILKLVWLYYFIKMNRLILNFGLSRTFHVVYFIFCGFFAGVLLSAFTIIPLPFKNSITNSFNVFFESVILAMALASLILLIIHTDYHQLQTKKRIIFSYCGTYIFIFLNIVGAFILSFFITKNPREILTIINSVNMILYNILPLLWLKRYGDKVLAASK